MHGTGTALSDSELVKVLKALADPSRLQMVHEVATKGELSCGEVGKCFTVSQPTVSHHLKILTDAGVLRQRTEGKHHIITVNHDLLDRVGDMLPGRFANAKLSGGIRSPKGKEAVK